MGLCFVDRSATCVCTDISGRLEKPAPSGNRGSMLCDIDWLGVQMCGPNQSIWVDRTANRSIQLINLIGMLDLAQETQTGTSDSSGRVSRLKVAVVAGDSKSSRISCCLGRRAARPPAGTPPLPNRTVSLLPPTYDSTRCYPSTFASDRDGSGTGAGSTKPSMGKRFIKSWAKNSPAASPDTPPAASKAREEQRLRVYMFS